MDHLKESLRTLVVEQQELAHKAALSTRSLGRLHQRLVIMERFLLASHRKGVAPKASSLENQGIADENEEKEEKEEGGSVKSEVPEQDKKKEIVKKPQISKANRCGHRLSTVIV